ncbi:chemotaxis protein CheD [Pelomonas cellulosilytica]|uniref:Chemotaxis protein CheD n=1 Tax=Pelomonas cellulosilytica TaxID=2906762 RepID=A0ABS8Y3S3_9BURK|nr:chemotaxis protein CheD [Pelomonas sp. P8]MCE4556695.1 chemotaxis protein CheD [Pelomonas sp. P8]
MKHATVALHPGDVACVDSGQRMETLLGSCVAIVLTDPRRTVGAMCHIVHAGAPKPWAGRDTAYGASALAEMRRLLRLRSIDAGQCLAWVYGGGHMFPDQPGAAADYGHVGASNAEWALAALQQAGIQLLGADLGGHAYRKLRWTVGRGAPEVEATAIPSRRRVAREPTA